MDARSAASQERTKAGTGTGVIDRHKALKRRERVTRLLLQLGTLLVIILVWATISGLRLIPAQYLPGPLSVWHAFIEANSCRPLGEGRTECGVQNYYLWEHLVASLQRIAVGLGLAVVFGLLIGLLMGASKALRAALEPVLNFIRALPPLGYIGLIIVWVGIGESAKYWLLFLAAFPPIVISTIQGVTSVNIEHIQAARSMGANTTQITRFVIIPSAIGPILQGIRLAVGFAWTTVVAAELNNGIPGIGGLAYLSGTQLNTPLTLACVIVIGIVALALDAIIQVLRRELAPWQGYA